MSAKSQCHPKDIALKTFFLGPQSENSSWLKQAVSSILEEWFEWRKSRYPLDGRAISEEDQQSHEFLSRKEMLQKHLQTLVHRFQEEVPHGSPRYIDHMFSEISVPALLGHIVTLLHHPNNICQEASRVGVRIEEEAISYLLKMVGYDPLKAGGHFTSGAMPANFEALIRARARSHKWLSAGHYCRKRGSTITIFEAAHQGWDSFDKVMDAFEMDKSNFSELLWSNPWKWACELSRDFGCNYLGPVVLVPNNKNCFWQKGVSLLGLGQDAFWSIELDDRGKLSVSDLENKIHLARKENRPILMAVSVAGTTELGELDPVHEVQNLLGTLAKEGIHIWHHVDAAYGGFLCSILRKPRREILIDDHYISGELFSRTAEEHIESGGCALSSESMEALSAMHLTNSVTVDPDKCCGAFLVRALREYEIGAFPAPKGPETLEGARTTAGAATCWLTAKSIGLDCEGYGRLLSKTIRTRQKMERMLEDASPLIRVAPHGETNILCFCVARQGEKVSLANERTLKIHAALSTRVGSPFYVSKTDLRWETYRSYLENFVCEWKAVIDTDHLTVIRLYLMNPFFDSIETRTRFPEEFVRAVTALL